MVSFTSLDKGRVRIDNDSDSPIFLTGESYYVNFKELSQKVCIRDINTKLTKYKFNYADIISPSSIDINDLVDQLNKRPYFFNLNIIDEDIGNAIDVVITENQTDFSTYTAQTDGTQKTRLTDGVNDVTVTGNALDVNVTGSTGTSDVNIVSNATDYSTETTLQAVLDELELKADLTETQPVSIQNTPIPVTQSGSWTVSSTQSGTWSVNQAGSWSVSVSNFPSVQPVNDNGGSLTIDATSLPLPTGAATLTEQQTQTTNLSNIYTRLNDRSQKTQITNGTVDATFTGTSLNVNTTNVGIGGTPVLVQQFTTVATTAETQIFSYTVTSGKTLYIKSILISSNNVGGFIKVAKGTFPIAYAASGTAVTNGNILLTTNINNDTNTADASKQITFPGFAKFGTSLEVIRISIAQRSNASTSWFISLIGEEL